MKVEQFASFRKIISDVFFFSEWCVCLWKLKKNQMTSQVKYFIKMKNIFVFVRATITFK